MSLTATTNEEPSPPSGLFELRYAEGKLFAIALRDFRAIAPLTPSHVQVGQIEK